MKVEALTERSVRAAVYRGDGEATCTLFDDQLPGFGLRIYPSGKKSFVLKYRSHGQQRWFTIGPYGVFTVEAARREALQRRADIAEPSARQKKAGKAIASVRIDRAVDESWEKNR